MSLHHRKEHVSMNFPLLSRYLNITPILTFPQLKLLKLILLPGVKTGWEGAVYKFKSHQPPALQWGTNLQSSYRYIAHHFHNDFIKRFMNEVIMLLSLLGSYILLMMHSLVFLCQLNLILYPVLFQFQSVAHPLYT